MTPTSPMTFADDLLPNAFWRRRTLLTAALPLLFAIILAAVGAFGTYIGMTFPLRLLHFICIGLVIGGLVAALSACLRRFWFGGELPFWAMLAVALVMAPPGGLITYQALTLWAPWTLPHVSTRELMSQALLINILVSSTVWALRRRSGQPAKNIQDVPAPVPADQSLRGKLPAQLRHAAILSLSAEDHYVRVRTSQGDALVLMNLGAAVDTLGIDAGVRIHRSHWVSRPIAEAATSSGSRHGVRVDEQTVLPVSRAGRKLLNALSE
jgi:MFS family permease